MKTNRMLLIVECYITKVLRWIRSAFTVLAQIATALFLLGVVVVFVFPKIRFFVMAFLFKGAAYSWCIAMLLQVLYQITVVITAYTLKSQIKLVLSNVGKNITLKEFYRIDLPFYYVVKCEGTGFQDTLVVRELRIILNAMARALRSKDVGLHFETSGAWTVMLGEMDKQ